LGLSSKQPIHFGEGEPELFPLGENMFMSVKSSVKVEPEIFDFVSLGELHIIGMDRWAGRATCPYGIVVSRLGLSVSCS
jgi:hypothetical protein